MFKFGTTCFYVYNSKKIKLNIKQNYTVQN